MKSFKEIKLQFEQATYNVSIGKKELGRRNSNASYSHVAVGHIDVEATRKHSHYERYKDAVEKMLKTSQSVPVRWSSSEAGANAAVKEFSNPHKFYSGLPIIFKKFDVLPAKKVKS